MAHNATFAAASIVGRDHLSRSGVLIGRPNQDAFTVSSDRDATIAIVADGCGSHTHSHIGAGLGVRLVHSVLRRLHRRHLSVRGDVPHDAGFWRRVRDDTVAHLRCQALAMTDEQESFTETVCSHLLFSINGAMATDSHLTFFSIGDGHQYLDGQLNSLGPFPRNQPPYIGYCLIDSAFSTSPEALEFKTRVIPTESASWFAVGTDGMDHYSNAVGHHLPGSKETLPSVNQLARDTRIFTNGDLLRRLLARANNTTSRYNRELSRLETDHGLLPDDTTLIVVRLRQDHSVESDEGNAD